LGVRTIRTIRTISGKVQDQLFPGLCTNLCGKIRRAERKTIPAPKAQVFVVRRIGAHAEDYEAAPIAALGQRQGIRPFRAGGARGRSHESRCGRRKMSYPQIIEYYEGLQHPAQAFIDPELKLGAVARK
jgi:hypothetical protein